MNKETVCAVVVTYNRKELLMQCLEALENQTRPLDAIYIVDNASTDGTPELLQEKCYINEMPPKKIFEPWEKSFKKDTVLIHYTKNHKNTGGAGGFHEGVKRAYNKGYNWLWLMDDDVKPDFRCLETLLDNKSKVVVPLRISKIDNSNVEFSAINYNLSNPFLIASTTLSVAEKYKELKDLPKTLYLENFSFEGPLIHRSIVDAIGYPRKDLFIYGDDTDYALKIRYVLNEKIVLISNAKMFRLLDKPKIINPFNWKTYYIWRNSIFINFEYGENILVKLKTILVFGIIITKTLISSKFDINILKTGLYAIMDFRKNPLPIRHSVNIK